MSSARRPHSGAPLRSVRNPKLNTMKRREMWRSAQGTWTRPEPSARQRSRSSLVQRQWISILRLQLPQRAAFLSGAQVELDDGGLFGPEPWRTRSQITIRREAKERKGALQAKFAEIVKGCFGELKAAAEQIHGEQAKQKRRLEAKRARTDETAKAGAPVGPPATTAGREARPGAGRRLDRARDTGS